ncbi:MAG: PEP-CTERM sorting domain-containing protein [Planctomycetes bacterium]|nr:PEP-CTERM sorting domain-containing protein [Planctomycetota bacterium]
MACAAVSQAAPVSNLDEPLGDSGWRIYGPDHYNLQVSVDGEGVTEGVRWVAITVSRNFRFGPDPLTGLYPSIELDFAQVEGVALDDLATRIIIQSEAINNSTGTDWNNFQWKLFGHGIAQFNRELTNPTTDFMENGWLIEPFTQFAWDYDALREIDMLNVWGGTVADGDAFFPGTGSGSLVIDVTLDDPGMPAPAIFKTALTPIPEPATVGLLALGGLMLLRRRR